MAGNKTSIALEIRHVYSIRILLNYISITLHIPGTLGFLRIEHWPNFSVTEYNFRVDDVDSF